MRQATLFEQVLRTADGALGQTVALRVLRAAGEVAEVPAGSESPKLGAGELAAVVRLQAGRGAEGREMAVQLIYNGRRGEGVQRVNLELVGVGVDEDQEVFASPLENVSGNRHPGQFRYQS